MWWNNFTTSISSAWHHITSPVNHFVHHEFPSAVTHVENIGKQIWNNKTFQNDVNAVASFTGKQIDKLTDLPKESMNLTKHLGDDLSKTASNLSLPLLIAGGVVLLLVIKK